MLIIFYELLDKIYFYTPAVKPIFLNGLSPLPTVLVSHLQFMVKYPLFMLPLLSLAVSTVFLLPFSTMLGLYGCFFILSLNLFTTLVTILAYLPIIRLYSVSYTVSIGRWFNLLDTDIYFDLFIDNISYFFAMLTINIGFFAILYAFSYFRGEPLVTKLIILIVLFILSMVLFVFASNLIVLFLGWELIGLTSFLLINFWTIKAASLKSSFKAMAFNKLSDVFILIFIVLSFIQSNSFDINTVIGNFPGFSFDKVVSVSLIGPLRIVDSMFLFLVLGSAIKSAQLIFHIWLPDSMEAPVPASALIHSATLVSAGIYLILRFNIFLLYARYLEYIIIVWGVVTGFYGGIVATSQTDLKRILAYSTISHCGNMFLLAGLGRIEWALIYLCIHGYFKAISFLAVGNIIRFYKNNQDLRRMGMACYYMPFDCFLLLISLINLGGLPLTLGLHLKHFLLLVTRYDTFINTLLSINIIFTTLTGLIYTIKIIYYVFFDFKKGNVNYYITRQSGILVSKYMSSTSNIIPIGLFIFTLNAYFVSFFLLKTLDLLTNYIATSQKNEPLEIIWFNSAQDFFILNLVPSIIILLFILVLYAFTLWRYTISYSFNQSYLFGCLLVFILSIISVEISNLDDNLITHTICTLIEDFVEDKLFNES